MCVCLKAQPSGRVSGVGVCLCARVTGARLWLGAGRGALRGGRGLGLLPFIGFHIPEAAGLLSLSWLGCLAAQARGPPPRFLIPASLGMRRLERAPPHIHQATLGLEVGAGEGPVFLQGGGQPPPVSSWGTQ